MPHPAPAPTADLNLKLLRYLVHYLCDHHSSREIETIAFKGRVPVADFMACSAWVTLEQFEALLASSRELMQDDATFVEACAYKSDVVGGHLRIMAAAITPVAAYVAGCKQMPNLTQISHFKPEVLSRSRVRLTYHTTKTESRLMCLSRQAQIRKLPRLWGLPQAHVEDTLCVARGDSHCNYEVRLYEARRWIPPALVAGSASALGLAMEFLLHQPVQWWWLALAGAAGGHLYELRRISGSNQKTQEEINAAYQQVARDEANARRELFALTQRQKNWGHLMEHEVVGREDSLRRVTDELETLNRKGIESRPTARIRTQVKGLRDAGAPEAPLSIIDDQLDQIDARISRVLRLAANDVETLPLAPRSLEVESLVEELRSRLRGLVPSRDVRVSVFAVREAPSSVHVDPLLFNRVIDNLLLNAAKNTSMGSIVVEVGGTPGFLTLKISDTGGGMPEAEIGALFRPLTRSNRAFAYGAGLSVVVQLLGRIGGKLEVMTRPNEGTTFWAHFPVESAEALGAEVENTPVSQTFDVDRLVDKVVTIRRSSGG
jgi:signal transduction histidine kinase